MRIRMFQKKTPPPPPLYYIVCFTEIDGIHACLHQHLTVRDALMCDIHIPDGRHFIRAIEAARPGHSRSLYDAELIEYYLAIKPWSLGAGQATI